MFKKLFSNRARIKSYLPQIVAMLFLLAFAVYAWQEPSQSPPQGNTPAPLNTGAAYQIKAGPLVINAGRAPMGLGVIEGNVGIGINPSKKLDVFGDVRALSFINAGGENLPATCDNNNRGQQYLLKGGSGEEDTLYICKVKQNAYVWQALDSPQVVGIWDISLKRIEGASETWQQIDASTVTSEAKKIICSVSIATDRVQQFNPGASLSLYMETNLIYKGETKLTNMIITTSATLQHKSIMIDSRGGGDLILEASLYTVGGSPPTKSWAIGTVGYSCYYVK